MQLSILLKRLYPILLYITKTYVLGLFIFFAIRVAFILFNTDQMHGADFNIVAEAFILGFHFDNLIICAISLLPLAFAIILSVLPSYPKFTISLYNFYYILAYTIVLAISIADIPYFQYFIKHFDISIMTWMENGGNETYNMLFTEKSYYKYYLLFIIVLTASILSIIMIGRQWKGKKENINRTKYLSLIIVLFLLSGLALSGKYGTKNLNIRRAYFCEHSFVNEVSINPTYYFIRSLSRPVYVEDDFTEFISESDAIKLVRKYIKSNNYIDNISPICHKVEPEGDEIQANVVIVFMESMASFYVTDRPDLTPTLSEIKKKSYYFSNIFSCGTHTNQGIFSTLFGIPALFEKNITDNRGVTWNNQINEHLPICEGLPFNLNEKGYTSSFFIAHTKNFDNMGVFLNKNGYKQENIYSIEDYPKEKYVNSWGVNDEFLFDFALNKFNQQKSPFFGSIMTISNHPPYTIPKEFMYISSEQTEQTVFYTDNCINNFLTKASKQDWYKNTIFVFVGDHGRPLKKTLFDMPLDFNHIPLIIYSPLFEETPQVIDKWGSQIDIFPTVMGFLNIKYENNSLGIDLMKNDRGYTIFSSDGKLGYIDNDYIYSINNVSKIPYLYKYKNEDPYTNLASQLNEELIDKQQKAAATVVVANYMLKKRLTSRK